MGFSFDADQAEEFSNVLPNGSYPVVITDAEYKPANSNPENHVISLEMAITEAGSPYDGWKVYDTYNVVNKNEMAERIGHSDLKKLCKAVGVSRFDEPGDLVGCSFLATTKGREYNGKTYTNVVGRDPLPAIEAQKPVSRQKEAVNSYSNVPQQQRPRQQPRQQMNPSMDDIPF